MRDMIKMVLVLTILSSFSGTLLAALRNGTKEQIELQELEFLKAPAVRQILTGVSNDPIKDRFKIKDGDREISFFVGVKDGKAKAVAFETSGKGYGGDIGVMVGIDISNDKVIGVGVTTHQETPGLGSRAKTDPAFAAQFSGMPALDTFKVKPDGGQIDAIGGATISSRGVCLAATQAGDLYERLKDQITQEVKNIKP